MCASSRFTRRKATELGAADCTRRICAPHANLAGKQTDYEQVVGQDTELLNWHLSTNTFFSPRLLEDELIEDPIPRDHEAHRSPFDAFLKPRAVPLSFGYLRVGADNSSIETYQQMLRDAGVARLYEDVPAIPHKYPALEEMLAEARPLDTIVLVRFDQISTNGHYVRHYVRRICELRLTIRILQRATAHMPPTAAVLHNFDQTLFVHALPTTEGRDDGSVNDAP